MPQLLQDISEVSSKVASSRIYLPLGYTKSSPKSGPCPVCGTCAWEVGQRAVFCKGTNESDIYIDNGDGTEWVAIKESNSWSGFRGFSLSEKLGASTKSREERDAEIAHNVAQRAKEEALRIASLPSLEVRNAHYRANLRPLESIDIVDLIKRGLTPEEIANAERLGAVGRGPSQTRKSGRDYLVLSQICKNLVGGQVAASGQTKYFWDNTFPVHLPTTDCNPHFEFAGIRQKAITKATLIVVVEGFLKALILQILAEREGLNWLVLGYAGGGGVNVNLSIAIKGYQERYECKAVLCPDSDVHLNTDVKASVDRNLKAASYDGVLWFNQSVKGVNLDDVPASVRASASVITVAEYWKRIKKLKTAVEPKNNIQYYKAGDVEAALEASFGNPGVTVNVSPTGAGKSYESAQMMKLLKSRGFYAMTISALYLQDDALKDEEIVKIYGRHRGHIKVNGAVRTLRSEDHIEVVEMIAPSNCHKSEQITNQIQAGLYDGGESIFQNDCMATCPLFKQCGLGGGVTEDGRGYGYLHQRAKLGKELAVALHPKSLPGAESGYYHPKILVIIDEFASIAERLWDVRTLTASSLGEAATLLGIKGDYSNFVGILGSLSKAGQDSKFGIGHSEAIETLKKLDTAPLDEIEGFLNEELKHSDKKDFDSKESWQRQLNRLIPEFITNLRQVVAGSGTVKVSKEGDITFTCHSLFAKTISNMNIVITDATTSKEEIMLSLGVSEVNVICSDMPTKDPRIVKIKGSKYTRNRSKGMRDTAVAGIEEIAIFHKGRGQETAVVDAAFYVPDYKDLDIIPMNAFSQSKGSNLAAKANALVIVGQLRPNMIETRDLYDRLTQNGLEKEWNAFYQMKCDENMTQAIGRLRSNRRPNEELTVYIMDGSYEGHYDAEMTIEELINEKATGKAKKIWLIAQALKAIGSNGTDGKATLRELETATGVSHSHVNSLLPFAATLLSALSLDELIDSLHGYGVSEPEIITIINEAILSASGADQDCVTEWTYEAEDECDDF